MSKHFTISKVEKLPDWEVEIIGEISLDFLNESKKEAINSLKNSISLPGFRPGQVPETTLIKTIGEMRILEEAAEVALGKEYVNIVEEAKMKPLTRPNISVTKLAPGIPLEFKVRIVTEPEFDLPDYKKIAANIPEETETPSESKEEETEDQKKFKENHRKEIYRLKILEALVKETKIDLPKRFVDAEAHHMLHHFQHDLEKAGIKWDDYLAQIKKTKEEIENGWKEQIETRAKTELILTKIAAKENLKTYKEVFDLLEKKD